MRDLILCTQNQDNCPISLRWFREPAHLFVEAGELVSGAVMGSEVTHVMNSKTTPQFREYNADPTHPIGNWKEAWEKAKERAGQVLSGKAEDEKSELIQ